MIETIEGKVASRLPHLVIIEAGGLGFGVLIPFSTFKTLPAEGETAKLLCHLHWREDGPQLFGFGTTQERAMFRLLTKVNKVGPKLALNIMSAAGIEDLVSMIVSENIAGLTAVKGVGTKLASRLVVELKEPITTIGLPTDGQSAHSDRSKTTIPFESDVRDVLENLGYLPREITRLLDRIAPEVSPDATLEQVVEQALRSTS